ncbi:MAG: MFS transporter [Nitrososphaerales archaeon]
MDEESFKATYRSKALKFIFLLGFVSLFADITYEGGRSIVGPFLAFLGASAFLVGLASGLGEFLAYGLRILSGYFGDKKSMHWFLTFFGYTLTSVSVPLLALAGNWELALILIILERVGKGVRAPSRDTILSSATVKIGRGYGFGIHEAIDQIGALIGPIIVSLIIYFKGGYTQSFSLLALPALVSISLLFFAKRFYHELPVEKDKVEVKASEVKLPRVFWFYLIFVMLSAGGFVHFQLISYHFKVFYLFPDEQIPLLFALAMGIDALIGLMMGKLYDKVGFLSLIAIPILTLPIAYFALSFNYPLMILSMILWGAVMGIHETVMRAYIADITSLRRRGLAFGIFNTAYGSAWFLGSLLMGMLYESNILYLIYFSTILEIIALIIFLFRGKLLRRLT